MSEIENTATIRVVADASGVEAGLRPAVDAARRAEQSVAQVGSGATGSARNVEAAQRNIVQSIQRTTLAMQTGGRQTVAYYEALARQRGVDPATLAPYLNALRSVEQAQAHAGTSSAQLANAMRMVPAQLSDIGSQLVGGASPFTILVQQGSQLRDSFGSVSAALRGVGSSLLGLINPYTVVAAVVGALGYAYKVGADESAALQRSLILSGNAAGVTASQLSNVSRQVASLAHSREAGDVIGQMLQTARIPAESLQKFAVLAIDSQRVLGKSVQETVQDFADLGKSPLDALNRIDDKYHTISASTYFQVKALLAQGKATEASKVAQDAYFKAAEDQKDKVLQTLTSWERAWLNIKKYTSDAASAVVDFVGGHDSASSEKVAALVKARQDLNADLARAKQRGVARDGDNYDPSKDRDVLAIEAQIDANKRAVAAIQQKDQAEQDTAKSQSKFVEQNRARKDLLGDSDILLTQRQLRQRDLAAAEQRANDNNLSAEEKKQALDIVRKKYYDVYLEDLDLSIGKLQQQLAIEDLIGQRRKDQVQAQLDLGNITQQAALNQTAQQDLASIDRKIIEKRAELAKIRDKQNSEPQQQQINDAIGQLQEQRLTREQQLKNDLLRLDKQRADASRELFQAGILQATEERDNLLSQVEAQFQSNQEIGLGTIELAKLRAARLDNAAALKEEAAASLESFDSNSALAKLYREQAQALRDLGEAEVRGANKSEVLAQQKELWGQIENTAHDTFVSIFDSGKNAFDRLRDTLKSGLFELLYQMTVKQWVISIGAAVTVPGALPAQAASLASSGSSVSAGSSLIGAAQAASNLYKTINGSVGSSLGAGVSSLGNFAGSSSISAFGSGMGMTAEQAAAAQAAYAQAGMQGTASAIGYGQMAGTAASYAAGAIGGHYIGNAIAGDYSMAHGQTVTNVAAAIGTAIAGPLGGVVGGALGGIANRAFGMGNKEVQTTGISGTLSSTGTTAASYSTWHQKGGWFRRNKDGTDTTAFSSDTTAALTNGLDQLKAVSSNFATSLGVDATSIQGYTKQFKIDLGKDGNVADGITQLFNTVGDELATKLVPNVMQFSRTGETASATLERLAGDFDATTQMAQLIGKTATEAFGTAGIASAAAREQLVNLAGSASSLTSMAASYAQNYLTEGQRLAPVKKAVDDAMSSLGLAGVTTREQFKQVIDSLDLTTEAGARQYVSMMQLSDAFAQVHAASAALAKTEAQIADERKSLQDQLDQLTMSSAELLAKQRDALDDSNKALFDQVQAAQKVKTAQDAAKTSLGDFITQMKSFSTTAKGLNNNLALGSLSTLTPEQQYAEARRQFELTRQQAAAGDTTAQGNLQAVEQTFLQLSQKLNGGDSQYSSDLATVMRTNDQLAQWATQSVDVAQSSLDALNDSSATLTDISATLKAIATGMQYLPAALSGKDLAQFTQSFKPIDFSKMGTLDMTALVSEIKSLREEVKALRADQQRQTGDLIQAGAASTQHAAETVVDGVRAAVTDAAYAEANSTRELK